MAPNKYHQDEMKQWIGRMIDAGWQVWLFQNPEIMFHHADEWAELRVDQCEDLFKQFVNSGRKFIPDPYDIEDHPEEYPEK